LDGARAGEASGALDGGSAGVATRSESRRLADVHTSKGSRTVVTAHEGGKFRSRLYVNCQNGQLGDATLVAKKHGTQAGAINWANKVLAWEGAL
jgi:hypothetical protein